VKGALLHHFIGMAETLGWVKDVRRRDSFDDAAGTGRVVPLLLIIPLLKTSNRWMKISR
jgi:hypothetical protein